MYVLSSSLIDNLAADDCTEGGPFHCPAVERGVLAFADQLLRIDCPFTCRVDHGHIGNAAFCKLTGRNAEGCSRATGHQSDGWRQIDQAFFDKSQGQRQCGFQSDNTIHGEIELDILFIDMMWRVVSGDRVNGAVGNALADRLTICRAA